jgi:hypothetical protein
VGTSKGTVCVYHISLQLLAVGTSKGVLCVCRIDVEDEEGVKSHTVMEMKAHPPYSGPQDERFGQLGKQ